MFSVGKEMEYLAGNGLSTNICLSPTLSIIIGVNTLSLIFVCSTHPL